MAWYVIVEYPRAHLTFWGPHVLRISTVDYTLNLIKFIHRLNTNLYGWPVKIYFNDIILNTDNVYDLQQNLLDTALFLLWIIVLYSVGY